MRVSSLALVTLPAVHSLTRGAFTRLTPTALLGGLLGGNADTYPGAIMGDEAIMAPKAHGTSATPVMSLPARQTQLPDSPNALGESMRATGSGPPMTSVALSRTLISSSGALHRTTSASPSPSRSPAAGSLSLDVP